MRFVRNYALSLALGTFFIVSWLIQTAAGWIQYAAEQREHESAPQLFGDSGYLWVWLESTFENWQSEFLQLFTMVVLTAFLIHRHSHESKDTQDQMKAQIEQILNTLKEERK
ncbi:MAG: hypothetical protein M3N29_10520 [Chloroflexota bacterium]|nr:hypothetical protein [Chloroflexota bacterium]